MVAVVAMDEARTDNRLYSLYSGGEGEDSSESGALRRKVRSTVTVGAKEALGRRMFIEARSSACSPHGL